MGAGVWTETKGDRESAFSKQVTVWKFGMCAKWQSGLTQFERVFELKISDNRGFKGREKSYVFLIQWFFGTDKNVGGKEFFYAREKGGLSEVLSDAGGSDEVH